jgi:hypothetical protein
MPNSFPSIFRTALPIAHAHSPSHSHLREPVDSIAPNLYLVYHALDSILYRPVYCLVKLNDVKRKIGRKFLLLRTMDVILMEIQLKT